MFYLDCQDSCLEVRSRFENKLHKWLARMVLPIAYLSLLALAAPDPVKDQRNHVSMLRYAAGLCACL